MIRIVDQLKQKIRSKDFITDLILTIFVFSLSFIPLLWFKDNQILLGYDNVYPLNPIDFLKDRIFSWTSTQGFGLDQSGQQGSLVIHFIDSIPQFFGASIQLSQKIVFSFWFFMLIFSAYIFTVTLEKHGFIKSKYLRFIFPVLYAVNFYVLQAWWIAERTKFSLMVATPLILAIIFPLIKGFITKKTIIKKSIVSALVLTIFNGGGWGGLSLYGGLLVVLLVFYLFYLLSFIYKKKFEQAVLFSVFFVFFVGWFLLLNAYTLLPFLLSTLKEYSGFLASAGGMGGLINWTRYLSENTSFLNLLRLQGIPDWYNSVPYHPYASIYLNNLLFIFISFLFPIFIFLSFLIKKNKERTISSFFIFLFLVSLFFTAGAHSPLGFIYEGLMRKIPGFIIFRSAFFKFGYAYWLIASILIGLFLSSVLEYISGKFKRNLEVGLLLTILTVTALVFYHFPYLKGDIFRIDKSDVSSRVGIASYVYDFSRWWKNNGENNKILLLPKLNDNWLFEQYKWKYLSLFPVLGNFANNGLVENTDQLTSKETELVNALYTATDDENYPQMDTYSSLLGITYFLVRKDFYHNLEGQRTEDPAETERKLRRNPSIKFVKSFGEWVLYKYQIPNPLFLTANKAVVVDGSRSSADYLDTDLLLLDGDVYGKYPFLFRKDLVYPGCISCKAESEEVSVQIPKPKVLLDSNLYDFVRLRDELRKPKSKSYDQRVFDLIGETLKSAGQVSELIYQEKGEIYVNLARTMYIDFIDELSSILEEIQKESSNPYLTAVITEYYLDVQSNFLNDLLQKSSLRSEQINIEKILYDINQLNDDLKAFYGEKDFNKNKYYIYEINRPKEYEIKILRSSLGILSDDSISKMSLQLDSKGATISPILENEFLNFGKVFLDRGNHSLKLTLPEQKNIVSYTKQERISGSNCFSSFVENFSPKSKYSISFSSKNNFDPTFFYFIDAGKKFSPAHIGQLSLAGEQVKQNREVVSPSRIRVDDTSNTLRVSFCASSLTEKLHENNIKDFKVVFLTNPQIVLVSNLGNSYNASLPQISFSKLDQTQYRVFVTNATDPFILLLTQRYSKEWVSNVGKHRKGAEFENAWIIDKKGSYKIDIHYAPQRYFYIGVLISVFSIATALFTIFLFKERNGKN